MIYAITALGYGGVFTAFTFLAPMMQNLAGFTPNAVSWILLGYGVAVAIGNIWGGKLADKHGAVPALKFIFAALAALLLVFQFTASVQYAGAGDDSGDGRLCLWQRTGFAGLRCAES
ncbi:Inner membrane transport protein ydhP [Kluyvera cryocrescens]|uniref:Inner membrane transport protein ydhP n=1 Tax=Kluyvera cryocrescens TaxID=580 RepID=A0A485BUX2_KLUCR|nr:Inner membrane transport protein ydhP [Kluyvera cryocrescens]